MQNKYHTIKIDEEHLELFNRHQELIRKRYNLEDCDLQLINVEAKMG